MSILIKRGPLTSVLTGLGMTLLMTVGMAQGTWAPTSSAMTTARDAHSMVTVGAKVLVIGGRASSGGTTTARTDYYDPSTGKFSATGSMYSSRSFFPAVILDNGKVLAPGGYQQSYFGGGTISSSELYNPGTGKWARTGSMRYSREQHSGTKLPNGNVLVAGGFSNGSVLSACEIYNPAAGTFTLTGSMATPRFGHTATLLTVGPNAGKVLVIGGRTTGDVSLKSTELYDPASGTWSPGPTMMQDRYRHTMTLLNDGTSRLLVTGGYSSAEGNTLATAEIFDPLTPSDTAFTQIIDPLTAQPLKMNATRMDHTAVCLSNGKVLIAGGWDSTVWNPPSPNYPNGNWGNTTASVDLLDVTTSSIAAAAPLSYSRHEQAALLLSNGTVLLTGGLHWDPSVHQTLNEGWVYTP